MEACIVYTVSPPTRESYCHVEGCYWLGWCGVGGLVWARLIGQKLNGNCREWARVSRVSCLVCYSAWLTVMPSCQPPLSSETQMAGRLDQSNFSVHNV